MVTRRVLLGGLLAGVPLAGAAGGVAGARPDPVVETSAGRVRGRRSGGVTRFGGIPYAAVGARFAPPGPVAGWTGVREAFGPGPGAPQLVSRLEAVVGPIRVPRQSEDCLSVNVWTPSVRGRRPVLVFLHGGAWVTGSGGQDWYDGARLAADGDVVVVTVNYRLGALGWLYSGELGAGNAGLRDQLAALRWVRENIDGFGGDPGRVTLAGQSAGALSVLALLSSPRAAGLFRRAVVQSAPTGIVPRSPADAEEVTARYLALAGVGDVRELAALPVERLLAAQGALMGASPPLRLAPPFHLVADGDLVGADLFAGGWGDRVERLVGTTRDEAMAWIVPDPRLAGLDRAGAIEVARDFLGDDAEAAYDRVAGSLPPVRVLGALTTDFFFERDLSRIARGGHVYRFDWGDSALGACHCVELPFVFGNVGSWRDAPLLAGPRQRELVREVLPSWGAFVRRGRPGWRAVREGGGVRRFGAAG